MSTITSIYENVREKLDKFGYGQSLPLAAVPLVNELIEDLIKTTQSLRKVKKDLEFLLAEKDCWELGVEPYKCDNARLLKELNQQHAQNLELIENYEEKLFEYESNLKNMKSDKESLLEQIQGMQNQLKTYSKQSSSSNSRTCLKQKKPFISTVRPVEKPSVTFLDNANGFRCTKCTVVKGYSSSSDMKSKQSSVQEIKHLERTIDEIKSKLEFQKKMVDSRDREIRRLSDLLIGGRPPAALAKDCCYKEITTMTQDINRLQIEKTNYIQMVDEYELKMHEAMQRSIELSKLNTELKKEMEALKTAALEVEDEANTELAEQENEIMKLNDEIERLNNKYNHLEKELNKGARGDATESLAQKELSERLNEVTQIATERKHEIERLVTKIKKQKERIEKLEKEVKEYAQCSAINLDEEKIRLKSERDFFQKEFLRMVTNTGSHKEVDFLQQQIQSKDEELRKLRSDLFSLQLNNQNTHNDNYSHKQNTDKIPTSSRSGTTGASSVPLSASSSGGGTGSGTGTSSGAGTGSGVSVCGSAIASAQSQSGRTSDCIQAVVLRTERERDCVRAEMERVRCERDTLREKNLSLAQLHAEELEKWHLEKEKLVKSLKELQYQKEEILCKTHPNASEIVLLREEIEEYKRELHELKNDNKTLNHRYSQLKTIQEQTQRTLMDDQKRLVLAEEKLLLAEQRANTLSSNKESEKIETLKLTEEIATLRNTYVSMEREKDKLLRQLDVKTERAYQLEYELKLCQDQRKAYERKVKELEDKLSNLKSQKLECDVELQETSTATNSLRQQIAALKASRDRAIDENGRLSHELAERGAEILTIKKQLSDSESEIERLKKQLRQYVQEVKKAEDLLMEKEKEREEMLQHYRSLSVDAVVLEGNNQSLEYEAVENKRVINELEAERSTLKKELDSRNATIRELEDKIFNLNERISSLEKELEEAKEEQLILRVDLNARQDLCDKLDVEKAKLNEELIEFSSIKQKLEKENEILRTELEQVDNDYKTASSALEDVLKKTRKDLEEQIKIDTKLNQELLRLKREKTDLLEQLTEEQEKRQHNEAFAHEMEVQNQELRQNITDDRFRQARSREASPRMPFT